MIWQGLLSSKETQNRGAQHEEEKSRFNDHHSGFMMWTKMKKTKYAVFNFIEVAIK